VINGEHPIVTIPIADLVEADDNPNVMGREQYELLVRSIDAYGDLAAIVVSPIPGTSMFVIVDGHHRARAMREVGRTSVRARVVALDERQQAALRVGLNRLRGEVDLGRAAGIAQELAEAGWAVGDLLDAGRDVDVGDVGAPIEVPDMDEPDDPGPVFLLELTFRTRGELADAKKALRRAAGRGADLGQGLLRLAGVIE